MTLQTSLHQPRRFSHRVVDPGLPAGAARAQAVGGVPVRAQCHALLAGAGGANRRRFTKASTMWGGWTSVAGCDRASVCGVHSGLSFQSPMTAHLLLVRAAELIRRMQLANST